jgi:predicted nuclease of predicted toxin-antitoxin system
VKLLFDQNLSYRIVENLDALYPESTHVRLVGLEQADDEAIWNYARTKGYAIVSKDSDFHQRSFLRGFPPKVIWVRCGNSSTNQIEKILRDNRAAIQNFCDDVVHAFLILGPSES